jgi:hypothetical protein
MKKHLSIYGVVYIIILISLFIGAFIQQEIARYRLNKYISGSQIKIDRDAILYGKPLDYSECSH